MNNPTTNHAVNPSDALHRLVSWLAIAYTIFVVYGSLVPLSFVQISFAEAVVRFREINYLELGIVSRADWVANILLFVPLSFLWLEIIAFDKSKAVQFFFSLIVFFVCSFFALGIEFTQQFFPQRTVSLNDIMAENIGSVVGIAAWWLFAERARIWLQTWWADKSPRNGLERLLYVYFLVLFGYNILPLDLTLSPVELYHKWTDGNIRFLPFTQYWHEPAQAFYELLTDCLIWMPLGALWAITTRATLSQIAIRIIVAAAAIEFFQLFVYSRVTDITDVFTASIGGTLGALLVRLYQQKIPGDKDAQTVDFVLSKNAYFPLLFLLWTTALFTIFWYPYDFQLDPGFLRERMSRLGGVPFSAYYFGTEFRAVTEALRRLAFFLPLGFFAELALINKAESFKRNGSLIAVIVISVIAAAVELGQVLLPEKFPNTADWFLGTLGGVLGILAVRLIFRNKNRHIEPVTLTIPWQIEKGTFLSRDNRFRLMQVVLATIAVVGISIWIVGQWNAVPYNLRELVRTDYPLLTAMALALAACWAFTFPVWGVHSLVQRNWDFWKVSLYLLAHGLTMWGILWLAIPVEAMDDLVGSPILSWPWEFERMGRFMGLFLVFSLALSLAALTVAKLNQISSRRAWAILAGALIIYGAASYWIVVVQAASDNLTELMADRASIVAAFWLFLALFLVILPGSILALTRGPFDSKRILLIAGLVAICSITSYLCMYQGTDNYIIKYNQQFSALQFLLSSDREHYVGGLEIFGRYIIVYSSMICLVYAFQRPFAFLVKEAGTRDKR